MAVKGYDSAPAALRAAITEAAAKTGVSEDYLIRLAGKESSFNLTARPPIDRKTGKRASTAAGAFQFLDGTWENTTKAYGGKYGITAQTSRFDARASAMMAAEFTKENQTALRKFLKRDPTPGELYMAHFMGAGGATQLLAAYKKNPNGAWEDKFSEQAAANDRIFNLTTTYGGVEKKSRRTYQGVVSALTETFDGPFAAKSGPEGQKAFSTYGYTPEAPKPTLMQGVAAAWRQESSMMAAAQWMLRTGDPEYANDANFRWTPELLAAATEGLDEEKANWVIDNVQSEKQIGWYRDKIVKDEFDNQTLHSMGALADFGLRGGASLMDLPAYLAGGLAGKAIRGGVVAGRLARAGESGLIVLAESAPMIAAKEATQAEFGVDDAILMGTTAFATGTTFGAIFGGPGRELDSVFQREARNAEAEAFERAGAELTDDGKVAYGRAQSGGSAATPEADLGYRGDHSIERKLDISVQGRLQRADNPEVRDLGLMLGQDPLNGSAGRFDESMFEMKRRVSESLTAGVNRRFTDAFDAWSKSKGVSVVAKHTSAREEFDELVGRKMHSPDSSSDPHVTAAADAFRDGYKKALAEAKAAGAKWAQDVPEDPNYFPIQFEREAFHAAASRFGDDGIVSVVEQGLRKANRKLEPAIARKIAEKYVSTVRSVVDKTGGTEMARVGQALDGTDKEMLRDLLKQAGVADDEIDWFIVANSKSSKARAPGSFRARTIIDAETKFRPDGFGSKGKSGADNAISVRDLADNNATRVWERYIESITPDIALAKNGFDSRGSFDSAIVDATSGRAGAYDGFGVDQANKTREALEYLRDRLYGVPVDDLTDGLRATASVLGDLNFARTMGQSGVAQIGDVPKIFQQTSIKAAWETFRLSDFFLALKRGTDGADGIVADLEEMTGVGTQGVRRQFVPLYKGSDEFAEEASSSRLYRNTKTVTKTLANTVGIVGGMTPINDFLGRWAVRAHLRHLSDIVKFGEEMNPRRMADYGLTPELVEELRPLFDGMKYRGRSIEDLNKAKIAAAHPEAFSKLSHYLSRRARLSVLETSPEMLPQWAGSTTGKVVSQFRSFQMASHSANFLHGIRMGPAYAAQSMMVSGVWAGMVYGAHTYTKSIGRPDQDEYLTKMLNPTTWGVAAFSRSADSGVMPTILGTLYDPVAAATDTENPFSLGRTSGLEAGLMGIPTVDLIVKSQAAIREAGADTFRSDKRMTDEDAARIQRLIPLNNTYLVGNALAAITGLFPDDETDD